MPDLTDFDALRENVRIACVLIEHDDRTALEVILRQMVDAIEAVSVTHLACGWCRRIHEQNLASTERRERE